MAPRGSPTFDAKLVAKLVRLTKEISTYGANPARRDPLIAEWNACSGRSLAPWQFAQAGGAFPVGLGSSDAATRLFVECVLAHVEDAPALSRSDAAAEVARLRSATPTWADAHATLRAMGHLVERPRDLARLVFFTDAPLDEMIRALSAPDGESALLGGQAVAPALPPVDPSELRELVALAERGIDAGDGGDRGGLESAAAELSRRLRTRITAYELSRVPSAMTSVDAVASWLQTRDLPPPSRPRFAELVAHVSAVMAHASDSGVDAALERVERAIPYPHRPLDVEDMGDPHELARAITVHVDPWLDPPPAVREPDVWSAAHAWARARARGDFAEAVARRERLRALLRDVDVPELRELLEVDEATRKARLSALFPDAISAAPPGPEPTRAPIAIAPAADAPPAVRRVRHAKFGVGTVVETEGAGPDAKLTIRFDDATRKLQARFVREAP